jgi:CheY-like chemotaxis protein
MQRFRSRAAALCRHRCPNTAPDIARPLIVEPRAHASRFLLISGDAVPRKNLEGRSILLVDDVSALRSELQTALEEVGAEVACADVARAVVYVERPFLSAVVLDCAPASRERRAIIRRLRERKVPFLIYSAEPPVTVTTGQGAPFVPRPSPPRVLIAALAVLAGPCVMS